MPRRRSRSGPPTAASRCMSCHSATRELEVLQDFLLGLFAADKTALARRHPGRDAGPEVHGAADPGGVRRGARGAAHPVHRHRTARARVQPVLAAAAGPARVRPLALRRDRTLRVAAARGGCAALRTRRRSARGHPGVDAGRRHALGARRPAPISSSTFPLPTSTAWTTGCSGCSWAMRCLQARRRRSSIGCRRQVPKAPRRVPWVRCGRWSRPLKGSARSRPRTTGRAASGAACCRRRWTHWRARRATTCRTCCSCGVRCIRCRSR